MEYQRGCLKRKRHKWAREALGGRFLEKNSVRISGKKLLKKTSGKKERNLREETMPRGKGKRMALGGQGGVFKKPHEILSPKN